MNDDRSRKINIEYYVSIIYRKIMSFLLSYPEIMFFAKIVAGLIILGITVVLFGKFIRGL